MSRSYTWVLLRRYWSSRICFQGPRSGCLPAWAYSPGPRRVSLQVVDAAEFCEDVKRPVCSLACRQTDSGRGFGWNSISRRLFNLRMIHSIFPQLSSENSRDPNSNSNSNSKFFDCDSDSTCDRKPASQRATSSSAAASPRAASQLALRGHPASSRPALEMRVEEGSNRDLKQSSSMEYSQRMETSN